MRNLVLAVQHCLGQGCSGTRGWVTLLCLLGHHVPVICICALGCGGERWPRCGVCARTWTGLGSPGQMVHVSGINLCVSRVLYFLDKLGMLSYIVLFVHWGLVSSLYL